MSFEFYDDGYNNRSYSNFEICDEYAKMYPLDTSDSCIEDFTHWVDANFWIDIDSYEAYIMIRDWMNCINN